MIERKKVFTASLWVIGIFGLSQILRLGSNLVVTRLLEPEMFGVMAIVYIVMNGVTMFSDLGLTAFIIRDKKGTDKNVLNTIWTMQIIRGWLLFTVVIFIALAILILNQLVELELDSVYKYQDLPFLLLVVGLTAVISGYKTMAPAIMSRDLNRGRLELIELGSQFLATCVMIFFAWKYVSIWALASSAVVAAIAKTVFTQYVFHVRHERAWDKVVVKNVFNFGKWIFIASALTYLSTQGDKLIFSTYVSAATLGIYSIAFMLSGIIGQIVDQLTSKIWFPVLSKIANTKSAELKNKYYEIRLKQDIIIFFFIGVLIAISPEVIEFLYDERFHEAGWMMQILAVGLLGRVISKTGLACLTALGQTKIRMKIVSIRSVTMIVSLPILFYYFGFQGAIWGVALNNFVAIPVMYIEMHKQNIFSLFLELRIIPLAAISYWVSCTMMSKPLLF